MSPKSIISAHPRLCLLALAAIMLLPGLSSLPLIDRDEPRFAHATVEMMYRGEWVVPYFNDEYRFDKPALTYWWMRVHFAIFGINEFGARLHSVISSFLCSLLIFGFARRLGCDNSRAFLAGAGWLTCLQVLVHSRMAVADMPLILFGILSMRALWELLHRDPNRPLTACFKDPWFYLLGVSMGLGFLAKGPLAQFIPLLAVLLWGGLNRLRKRPSPNFARLLLYFLFSAPIWLGLMAVWGLPALLATRGEFYEVGIGRHVVERGTGAFNSRLFLPGVYYLLAMLPFLLPWSSRIPDAFKTAWRNHEPAGTFLLAWFLSPFLIFSFYATQLPHYILPGYPAFFLLLFLTTKRHPAGWFAKTVSILSLVLPLGGAVFLFFCSTLVPAEGDLALLRPLLFFFAAALLFLGLASLLAFRNKPFAAIGVSLLTALLFIPFARSARKAHLTIRIRDQVEASKLDTRLAWKYKEPSLIWYFDDREQFTWDWWPLETLPEPGRAILVLENRRWRIDDETFPAILKREKPIPPSKDRSQSPDYLQAVAEFNQHFGPTTTHTVRGWSPATSSWIELTILVATP